MLDIPAPASFRKKYSPKNCALYAKVPRTAVLVSVRNARELRVAFENGVLWIDLKEPLYGALGCPESDQVSEFLECYDEITSGSGASSTTRPKISIALGDLADSEGLPLPPLQLQRFEMLKVGIGSDALSDPATSEKLFAWQALSGSSDRFVLVHYPDATNSPQKTWLQLLELAQKHGIARVLIDTLVKNGRSTLQHYSPELLGALVDQAKGFQIETMVAGSLRLTELEQVWRCGAKIIGIRSAVCQGNSRSEAIDTDKLSQLAAICINDHF